MKNRFDCKLLLLQVACLFIHELGGAAEPKLRCIVEQDGGSQSVETSVVTNLYGARAININDRFRFKPVVVGKGEKVDYIKLYSYYRKGKQVIPLHQVKHFPPNLEAGSEISCETHYVYSPLYE